MTSSELDLFFLSAAVLSALMALVSLLRRKSLGASAYFQAGGYVAFAASVIALREKGPTWVVASCAGVVVICLVADFVLRAGKAGANRGAKT